MYLAQCYTVCIFVISEGDNKKMGKIKKKSKRDRGYADKYKIRRKLSYKLGYSRVLTWPELIAAGVKTDKKIPD